MCVQQGDSDQAVAKGQGEEVQASTRPVPLHPQHPGHHRAYNATPSTVGSVTPIPEMDPSFSYNNMDVAASQGPGVIADAGTATGTKVSSPLEDKTAGKPGTTIVVTNQGDGGKVDLGQEGGGGGTADGAVDGAAKEVAGEGAAAVKNPRWEYSLFLLPADNPFRLLVTAAVRGVAFGCALGRCVTVLCRLPCPGVVAVPHPTLSATRTSLCTVHVPLPLGCGVPCPETYSPLPCVALPCLVPCPRGHRFAPRPLTKSSSCASCCPRPSSPWTTRS